MGCSRRWASAGDTSGCPSWQAGTEERQGLIEDWPEAEQHGAHRLTLPILGERWVVFRVPPEPFLKGAAFWKRYEYDRATYGPEGTIWAFTVQQVIERLTGIQLFGGRRLLNRLLRKFVKLPGLSDYLCFIVPEEITRVSIDIVRCTIHGKVGTDEEVAHVLHMRTSPAPDVAQDANALKVLGGQVAGLWADFLSTGVTPYGQGAYVRQYLPPQLQYDEIRLAYLRVPPNARPSYLVPTQYVPYTGAQPATVGSALGSPLPYEVALGLSFNTELRGARHKGRLYLGPLMTGVMGTDGQFSNVAKDIGKAFGEKFIKPLTTTTGVDLHVLSMKFGESFPVSGVRVGLTPDSQRRRRRSRPEGYTQVYGTPMGVPYVAPV